MARRCRVSRVSVREAYRSLEELGVVTVRRGADGGAFVAVPGRAAIQNSLALVLQLGGTSSDDISDAWSIQPVIAQLAARHARPADIARLRRVIAREEAALRGDVGRPADHTRFERALARCAHNALLAAVVNCLADVTKERTPALLEAMPAQICRFQRAILGAIERRDEDAADLLMRDYVRTILRPRTALAQRRRATEMAGHQRNSRKAA